MRERLDTATRRAGDIALACAFVAAIVLVPLIAFALPPAPASIEREFRRPAPKPAAPRTLDAWLSWPDAFDAWYRDHFGLRTTLIRLHNVAKLEGFGVSPTSEIVAGPGQCLFTTRDNAVGIYRGVDPLSQRELELWTAILADRRAWCAERGIAYVFAIAPNKETIYPERWPPRLDKVGRTRREQLALFVASRSDFPLLDLTEPLLAAKRAFAPHDVYFQLGTHWNDRGAVYASDALLDRVRELVPGIAPRELGSFRFEPTDYQDDSWAGRLYMEDLLRQENVEVAFERRIPAAAWQRLLAFLARKDRTADESLRYEVTAAEGETPDWRMSVHEGQHVTTEIDALDAPRAVVLHDSMGEKLRPLLAEHFSRCAFRWVSNFDTDVIEAERPDVVIQVFVERALAAFSLSTSPLDTQERLAREFEASTSVLLPASESLRALEPASTARAPIELVPEGSALRVRYGGGQLLLPELEVPSNHWPVLRIELDSPHATSLLLEFLTTRFPTYARLARGVQRAVVPGRNVVYVKLRVPDLTGRLRLQPGLVAGEYVIHALEVRSVAE